MQNGMPLVTSPRLMPTAGAYQSPNLKVGANHVWVAKLSPAGALAWDAVIGGSGQEQASGIDVDSSGQVYVAGFTGSTDFPVTPNNGIQQTLTSKAAGNAFLAVLNPSGSQLVYATYLGGSGTDIANAVAAIPGRGVAIGGITTSPDLPVTPNANQSSLIPNKHNGFYAVLNPPGLTIPAPASTTPAAAGHLKPRDESSIVTYTYTADVVKGISPFDVEFIHYEFVVLVDSDTGDVVDIIVFETTTEGIGPFSATTKSVDFLDLPAGTTDADVSGVLNDIVGNIGFGTIVELSGSYPSGTSLPSTRARAMDTTLAASAIGLRLAFPPAIVNGASFVHSAVSPGEIVTIFSSNLGPAKLTGAQLDSSGKKLSTSVAGTQIFFDSDPAPIIYTSAGQVSVVVPYSVASKTSVSMIPFYNGALQQATTLPVAAAAPGIFTVDGRQAASVNPDGSANSASHPIARGATIVMFATGEGQTNPAGVDGQLATSVLPKPVLPVSVTVGGKPAQVAYYGAAPDLTAGLMQLNVVVPSDIQPGNAAVVLTVGTTNSQSGVTIAVK
jgi:uncharacterized protein (TIGR03437 family)